MFMEMEVSVWFLLHDVAGILISIQALLSNPYPLSPANCKAAGLFCENKAEYKRKVLEIVAESCKED